MRILFLTFLFISSHTASTLLPANDFIYINDSPSAELENFTNFEDSPNDHFNQKTDYDYSDYRENSPMLTGEKKLPLQMKGKWQSNNMAMWGKRSGDYLISKSTANGKSSINDKQNYNANKQSIKKWNRKKWSGRDMAMWGKRNSNQNDDIYIDFPDRTASDGRSTNYIKVNKRWSGKDMAMWGKRGFKKVNSFRNEKLSSDEMEVLDRSNIDKLANNEMQNEINLNDPIRSKNRMLRTILDNSVTSTSEDLGMNYDKRWTGKEMAMWGKRNSVDKSEGKVWFSDDRSTRRDRNLGSKLQKRWSGKDMAMWGKRIFDVGNRYKVFDSKRRSGKDIAMWGNDFLPGI